MEQKEGKKCECECWFRPLSMPCGRRIILLVIALFLVLVVLAITLSGITRPDRRPMFLDRLTGNMFDRSTWKSTPASFVGEAIILPEPNLVTTLSFEDILNAPRSRHEYDCRLVTEAELSQVLYAAQGFSHPDLGERTAPSAFNVYPYRLFVVARDVEGVDPGVYQYLPETNSIRPILYGREFLQETRDQKCVREAPAIIVMSADISKMIEATGGDVDRAETLVLQESGHISQNIYLQASALGMSTVVVAGFNEKTVKSELGLPEGDHIIYLQPIGGSSDEGQATNR